MRPNAGNPSFIGIREVARLAGVSTATVSRVINHPELTSPEIRARVKAVIEEQRYVPNQAARSIFSHSTDSVAIFIYDMSNPFFIQLIQELNRIAFAEKHALLICDTSNNAAKEHEYLDYCTATRVKSIILTEGFDFVANEENPRVPLVMFDRSGLNKWASVHSDNAESVSRAVYYLYNLGHRYIACAAPDMGLTSIRARRDGFQAAAEELGVFREMYVYREPVPLDVETGYKALNYYLTLPKPPTAIVCANDMIAQGVLMRARELHIEIPRSLSVIGFDGVPSPFYLQPLTTIKQNITAIAETLFHLCTHPSGQTRHITIPTEFIYGSTCSYCEDALSAAGEERRKW